MKNIDDSTNIPNNNPLDSKVKEVPTQELKALLAMLKEKSKFSDFLKFCELLVVAGRQVEIHEHHRIWYRLINNPRLALECARGHGKTTFWSIAYPLWKMVTNPNYHICIISYSESQSKAILRNLRLALESTPAFQDMIPQRWKPGSWGKTEVHLLNRSYVNCKSFGSSIRGGHYDLIIVDDPLKDRSSMPQDQQENVFFGVISPALKPNGQIIVVGTPVKFGDLFDMLAKNKQYKHYRFPALNEQDNPHGLPEGQALWPGEFSMEVLDKKKEELQQYWFFAREFLLQRVDPENAPFKQEWIKYYDKAPERMVTLMSVDPAITYQGDYTGIVVTGTDVDNNTHVLASRKLRTANINEIVDTIMDVAQQFNVKQLLIEAIGFQRLFKFWLYKEFEKRNYYMGIEEIKGYSTTKNQRILSLQPKIEAGQMFFRRSDTNILSEFMAFPKNDHDDLIDALSMQVGKWQKPDRLTFPTPTGTWQELFEIEKAKLEGPYAKLFEDLRDTPTNSCIVDMSNKSLRNSNN